MLGTHAHEGWWLCELYLECSSHICSVIYVKYVYSSPCYVIDASSFIYIYRWVPLKPDFLGACKSVWLINYLAYQY